MAHQWPQASWRQDGTSENLGQPLDLLRIRQSSITKPGIPMYVVEASTSPLVKTVEESIAGIHPLAQSTQKASSSLPPTTTFPVPACVLACASPKMVTQYENSPTRRRRCKRAKESLREPKRAKESQREEVGQSKQPKRRYMV